MAKQRDLKHLKNLKRALMLEIEYSKSFKKAFKKLNENEKNIIWQLANNEELASKYKDHALIGSYKGFRSATLSQTCS